MADGVQIDTGQVNNFGKTVRSQADQGFTSIAGRGTELHSHGVVFGAQLPGSTIVDAKSRYAKVLENTDANLRAHQQAAVIFAEVAEQIAHDFSSADLGSEAGQRKVDDLLQNAISRANTALGVTGNDGGWAG